MSGNQAVFTVQNIGPAQNQFWFTCSFTGSVIACSPSLQYVDLPSGQSTQVTVTYQTGAPGSGTVRLDAQPEGPGAGDDGYYNVSVAIGPPPTVDLTLYQPRRVDYGMCFNACGAATYAQSTVPYVSLDAPRSITLVYNEDRTALQPFVFADVSHTNPAYPPTKYQLQVKVNGVLVTFLNGEQTLNFAYPGLSAHRLAGQFDAGGYATGVYPMDIPVTSVFPNGSVTSTANSHLVVLDERNSPIARGWSIAGWQRVYPQADGSVLIAEGDGSYTHFLKSGGVFQNPWGEFGRVTDAGPSTAKCVRTYPDSTRVTFNSTGLPTQIVDRFGNTTTFTHTAGSNKPRTITDPQGLTTTLNYNANGLSSIVGPWRATTLTVAGTGTLTAIQDPDGVSTTFGYDGSLRLQTISAAGGCAR